MKPQFEELRIRLPTELAQMVREQVAAGAYASNSQVVEDALRMWRDRAGERETRLKDIRAKIDRAAENPERVSADQVRAHFDGLHRRCVAQSSCGPGTVRT